MPELPDIELYLACLNHHVKGKAFTEFKLCTPFALRTVSPKPQELVGVPITDLWRIGKRVAFGFESDACMVVHLMIAGRFRWGAPDAKPINKLTHALWRFPEGTLSLTEAGSKKRAGIWLLPDKESAQTLDPGGIDPLSATVEEFRQALTAENRTLKRALTNPKRFSGVGNAYSDEILHAARLSPLKLSQSLTSEEATRLQQATASTLTTWRERLIAEFKGGEKFPGQGQVTAFRPDFAAHGKFGQPCPVCRKPIQHIVYADNETNYCAQCQNEGRILADRSLSRLLKDDWPRSFADEEG
jgi:formamidopyrimidine-DNA glycosylase